MGMVTLFLHFADPTIPPVRLLAVVRVSSHQYGLRLHPDITLIPFVPYVLFLACAATLFSLSSLMLMSTMNAHANVTTNENMNMHSDKPRYQHFQKGLANPFSRGWRSNWAEFFRPPPPEYYSAYLQARLA